MPAELLLVGVSPYPHPHHDTAPRKPVVDLGSIMIYKDSQGLENVDTHNMLRLKLELRGQIFTRACYYSFCSCNKVLVNNCVKLEELLSV